MAANTWPTPYSDLTIAELRERLAAAQEEERAQREARSKADKGRRLAENAVRDLSAAIMRKQAEEIERAAQAKPKK